jgi:hypothetical protein
MRMSLLGSAFTGSLSVMVALALSLSPATAGPQTLMFPPANDDFANATNVNLNALPFVDLVDITSASFEGSEPFNCAFSYQTIWYRIIPTTGAWIEVNTQGGDFPGGTDFEVYRDTGFGLSGLALVRCGYSDVTFYAHPDSGGGTYYVHVMAPCCSSVGSIRTTISQGTPVQPVCQFYYYPSDPSTFDVIQFNDQSYDPAGAGIQSRQWDFGDGGTSTDQAPTHNYATEGARTVQLTITTTDGRTATYRANVSVRTHDIAITKFRTPSTAAIGQTKQITIGIRNTRYAERARVDLFKSALSGSFPNYVLVGSTLAQVPVRASNRTTDFNFNYTFTDDDQRAGKVTFRAQATLDTARDAFPADNEAISSSVRVSVHDLVPAEEEPQPEPGTAAETRLALLGVAPNPVRSGTQLVARLSLAAGTNARIEVLDVAGRVMMQRDLSSLGPGVHETRLDWARSPAAGTYWVRVTQGGQSVSTKVAVLQ